MKDGLQFLLHARKWTVRVLLASFLSIVLGAMASIVLQNPKFAKADQLIPMPVVPIFAALNTRDQHVVFINEKDLGYRAKDSFTAPMKNQQLPEIEPNTTGKIPLAQPDALVIRETTLQDIKLGLGFVEEALQQGKDHARVNVFHEKSVFGLASGEKAMWIKVYHPNRMQRYYSGIVYVVRENQPVILFKLSSARDFKLTDLNDDGYLDIFRLQDQGFLWTFWDGFKWQPESGHFEPLAQKFTLKVSEYSFNSIQGFIQACLPFLFVWLLVLYFGNNWFSIMLVALARILYVFSVLALCAIMAVGELSITWVLSTVTAQYALIRLSRTLLHYHSNNAPGIIASDKEK